jgi:phage protein D
MAEHQGPMRHAACRIIVDGEDVTARVDPYLISVKVIDTLEGDFDTCALELDDRNAQLQIPQDGSRIIICLGWDSTGPRPYSNKPFVNQPQSEVEGLAEEAGKTELPFGGPGLQIVFSGIVAQVESGFTRKGGGRRLWIEGTSNNNKGKGKEVQNKTLGKGKEDDGSGGDGGTGDSATAGGSGGGGGGGEIPLQQVMSEVFQKAGLNVKLSPQMMNIKRDFWHVNESAHNFGQRMADEMGGYFKVANGTAILFGKNEDMGMGFVDVVWGVNLIGWRIKPFSSRAQWAKSESKFFDLFKGAWEGVEKSIGGSAPFGGASAAMNFIQPVANKANGEQNNGGGSADSEARRGNGWVLLNGDPRVKAGARLNISGARPGVDGTYLVTEAEHNYQRGVGFTTRCNVGQPELKPAGYKSWKIPAPAPAPPPPPDTRTEFEKRFQGEDPFKVPEAAPGEKIGT